MRVQVLYASQTGNTEKLAKAVFRAIPERDKDIAPLSLWKGIKEADIYFVGFWTDKGNAGFDVLDFIGKLHGKQVAFFGTCGMGGDLEYYRGIENRVRAFLHEDNEYLGAFICQGRMPMRVREYYEQSRNAENNAQIEFKIRNFDRALLHPDTEDIMSAGDFVARLFQKTEN